MSNTGRVDTSLFQDQHYLGKPAEDNDRIVSRRIAILKQYNEFFGKNLDVIEVGCGNGNTIIQLSPLFHTALGIDIFDYSSEFTALQQKYGAFNCTFKKLDLETYSRGIQFDRLISFEVIEHLKKEDNVEEYYKLLKPEGIAAITVPNKCWIFETHGAKLPLLPWNRVPFFSWLPRPIHERFANARIYTRRRILNLLKKHHFEILDSRYITAPMDVLEDGCLKECF